MDERIRTQKNGVLDYRDLWEIFASVLSSALGRSVMGGGSAMAASTGVWARGVAIS